MQWVMLDLVGNYMFGVTKPNREQGTFSRCNKDEYVEDHFLDITLKARRWTDSRV